MVRLRCFFRATNSNVCEHGAGLLLQCMAKSRVMSEHAKDTPRTPDTAAADATPVPEAETTDETAAQPLPKEIGGREGPEPVRYGDWEKNGRCIDF